MCGKLPWRDRQADFRALAPQIVTAGPVMRALLRVCGFVAITMPWGIAYVDPEHADDESVWIHEAVHLSQLIERGPIWFVLGYLVLRVRYGYARHPWEIEAYERELYGYTAADIRRGYRPLHRIVIPR